MLGFILGLCLHKQVLERLVWYVCMEINVGFKD